MQPNQIYSRRGPYSIPVADNRFCAIFGEADKYQALSDVPHKKKISLKMAYAASLRWLCKGVTQRRK